MTMSDNLKFSRHKDIRESGRYERYDNYDAIEVSYTDAIPNDYDGVMGVPISFLDKYCPEQFEILGMCENEDLYKLKTKVYTSQECRDAYWEKFGKKEVPISGKVPGWEEYDTVYLMDQVRDVHETDSNWVEEISLRQAISRLSPREKRILALRFYAGKTQTEVAAEIGISQAQVSRLEKNALTEIKKYL